MLERQPRLFFAAASAMREPLAPPPWEGNRRGPSSFVAPSGAAMSASVEWRVIAKHYSIKPPPLRAASLSRQKSQANTPKAAQGQFNRNRTNYCLGRRHVNPPRRRSSATVLSVIRVLNRPQSPKL